MTNSVAGVRGSGEDTAETQNLQGDKLGCKTRASEPPAEALPGSGSPGRSKMGPDSQYRGLFPCRARAEDGAAVGEARKPGDGSRGAYSITYGSEKEQLSHGLSASHSARVLRCLGGEGRKCALAT